MKAVCLMLVSLFCVAGALAEDKAPYWLEPMSKLHAEFTGDAGYVAQLGDSITVTMAFWSALAWCDPNPFIKDDGLPKSPEGRMWKNVIKGAREGKDAGGCGSGWTSGMLLGVTGKVISERKPEVAIIMIGTNDGKNNNVPPDYRKNLETIVQKCLDAKCIPILNTIPPIRGKVQASETINTIIKDVAEKSKIPLVDYYGEIMKRQPGNAWDGTLMSDDGLHPSAGDTAKFSDDNLAVSGYALRTWLNFLAYREVYFKIIAPVKR